MPQIAAINGRDDVAAIVAAFQRIAYASGADPANRMPGEFRDHAVDITCTQTRPRRIVHHHPVVVAGVVQGRDAGEYRVTTFGAAGDGGYRVCERCTNAGPQLVVRRHRDDDPGDDELFRQ